MAALVGAGLQGLRGGGGGRVPGPLSVCLRVPKGCYLGTRLFIRVQFGVNSRDGNLAPSICSRGAFLAGRCVLHALLSWLPMHRVTCKACVVSAEHAPM